MAHSFDTGLAVPQRTLLRQSAVTALARLKRANGGYLANVLPWGGVIRGYTDDLGVDLLFTALQGQTPVVAISLGDRTTSQRAIAGFTGQSSVDLLVYFFSSHKRSDLAGRLELDVSALADDHKDPGLEVAFEHVEELLTGQALGGVPGIKQCVWRSEEEIRTQADFSLWCQTYNVTFDRVINANRGVTQFLTGFRTKVRTADTAIDATPQVEAQTNVP